MDSKVFLRGASMRNFGWVSFFRKILVKLFFFFLGKYKKFWLNQKFGWPRMLHIWLLKRNINKQKERSYYISEKMMTNNGNFFCCLQKKILGAIMMAMQNIVVNSPHWKTSWLLISSWFSFTISWNGVNRKHLFLYPQDKKPDMSVKS